MNTYHVGVTIFNTFCIEADTQEEAEFFVHNMDNNALLNQSDFNITFVDNWSNNKEENEQ